MELIYGALSCIEALSNTAAACLNMSMQCHVAGMQEESNCGACLRCSQHPGVQHHVESTGWLVLWSAGAFSGGKTSPSSMVVCCRGAGGLPSNPAKAASPRGSSCRWSVCVLSRRYPPLTACPVPSRHSRLLSDVMRKVCAVVIHNVRVKSGNQGQQVPNRRAIMWVDTNASVQLQEPLGSILW